MPYEEYSDDDDDIGGYGGYGGYNGSGGYGGYNGSGGSGGYSGSGGGYGGGVQPPPACSGALEEIVEGGGFFEYEGREVLLDDLDAEGVCGAVNDLSRVDGGAFQISVTTSAGARAMHLFVDVNGDGIWQLSEPDWRLGDSRETYVSEHGPKGGRYRVYGVKPEDFGRFRSVEVTATGLSSSYQLASVELGEGAEGVPCEGCFLEAPIEAGDFRVEGVYKADVEAPTGFLVRLSGPDVVAGPVFSGTLGPPVCSAQGHLMRCSLRASDFVTDP